MSKTFPQKSTNDSMSVLFSIFGVLSRFCMFLSDEGTKALQKAFYKRIVSKSFYKNIRKKTRNRFFLDFVSIRFWAFRGEGILKKLSR
jgi:hypothetical protein